MGALLSLPRKIKPPTDPRPQLVLFGSPARPWTPAAWHPVSDTVRGGRSHASLASIDPSRPDTGVVFEGLLDAHTLGGAGFASVVFAHPIALPRPHALSAFVLDVDPLDPAAPGVHTFTLAVRDAPRSSAGPQLIFQADFSILPSADAVPSADAKLDQLLTVRIPFAALQPTLRGRPAPPNHKPFDPANLAQISLMARSFFGSQAGPFLLHVRRLAVQ
ncbi:hypothetical protein PtA15_9A672 [Puccinia triticina]|uniref:NADH:ubiquinone oxidoreductase intermediate-associated protein 30 domain-containing protein n=1 Tax=Puccinia triticina TaxID=208348 RepID=A0ABY7CV63_9BASI|nr:uncharacterized protein PtA15_9A672 [Puccinia triticina]WAQ88545.1 hypothetical protein PtA15_9A672 [Puccinia triticina]